MLTAEEALRSVDPSLSEEERERAAQNIIMGDAALTAYLDSRSPLERIIAEASGAKQVPAHADLTAAAEGTPGGEVAAAPEAAVASDGSPAAAIDTTAVEDEASEDATRAAEDAELAAAKERVAELEQQKGA